MPWWIPLLVGCALPPRIDGEALRKDLEPLLPGISLDSCQGIGISTDGVCRGTAKGYVALQAAQGNGWKTARPAEPLAAGWARPDACAGVPPFDGSGPHILWRSERRQHDGLEFVLLYHEPTHDQVCVHAGRPRD